MENGEGEVSRIMPKEPDDQYAAGILGFAVLAFFAVGIASVVFAAVTLEEKPLEAAVFLTLSLVAFAIPVFLILRRHG
jgi:uncharacterized membrane protein